MEKSYLEAEDWAGFFEVLRPLSERMSSAQGNLRFVITFNKLNKWSVHGCDLGKDFVTRFAQRFKHFSFKKQQVRYIMACSGVI